MIIIAACKDECASNLSFKVKKWFQSLGSKHIHNVKYRYAFCFIGMSGKTNNCHEKISSSKLDKVVITQVFQINIDVAA